MKFVDDVKECWKWWSVRIQAAGAALFAFAAALPDYARQAWEFIPADFRAAIGDDAVKVIAASVFVLAILARVVKQDRLDKYRDGDK